MRRLLLITLLVLPVTALAEPAMTGNCEPGAADAAGTLVRDLAALPQPPTLDLKSLETRIRATSAINMFGKLAIKGRVDGLVQQAGSARTASDRAALKAGFDALLGDVATQLDAGGDRALAADVRRSSGALFTLLLKQRG